MSAGLAGALALVGLGTMAMSFARMPADAALEAAARRYTVLALAFGQAHPLALDTYYGPAAFVREAHRVGRGPLLQGRIAALARDLADLPPSPRRSRLVAKVRALGALAAVAGETHRLSFSQEAKRLYAITITVPDAKELTRTRAALDRLLPGRGELADRLKRYEARFEIAPPRRRALFRRALAECRARTIPHWPLAPGERIDIVWTDNMPDAAWHHYEGEGRSRLAINPAAIGQIGTLLDMACHEGYPGHHAQFLSEEAARGGGGAPLEDRLVLTRSPAQLLREGAAEYGVELAFPPAARAAFMGNVLFRAAGFDPREAPRYVKVHALARALAQASTAILCDYRDGQRTFFDAAYALQREALISNPRGLLRFVDTNETYVLGYAFGHAQVKRCVEARAARAGGDAAARWRALHAIIAHEDIAALHGAACAQGTRTPVS